VFTSAPLQFTPPHHLSTPSSKASATKHARTPPTTEFSKKATLKSQKGQGLGVSSFCSSAKRAEWRGKPLGGEAGRDVLLAWQNSAAAMPQPLSKQSKEELRTSYVQGYAAIGIVRTRIHAHKAINGMGRKFSGESSVSHDACRLLHSWSSFRLFHS
jgi:hypothetical protein